MSKNKTETAVLVVSDVHYGKKTSSFNRNVCKNRLAKVASKVCGITELLTSGAYKFDELVILLMGDLNDGTDIYPSQTHHQELSNVEAQADEIADYLAGIVRGFKPYYPRIRIETVPGNHGRSGRAAHEAANWDIVAYRYLRGNLKADGIPVHMGDSDSKFVRKVGIRRWDYLLFHGHQIKGSFAGIPSYGITTRIGRWACTKRYGTFHAAICGHFHTFMHWPINRIQALISGTCVTDDLWSLEDLGWESVNLWPFFGVNDERTITWKFDLECADDSP